MNGSWAINIDVEGFSTNYEHSEDRKTFAIKALSELMDSIVKIGTQCFPGDPATNYSDRLFAHQFGDGFIVCSDFPEPTASRAIAISATLIRHMILKGYATKVAISSGEMSDIKGCYPQSVRNSNDERIDLGMGLMTVISVMGTALTKAHKLSSKHKGSVLILDNHLVKLGLDDGVMTSNTAVTCVDWVSSTISEADDIAHKAGLLTAPRKELIEKLTLYYRSDPLPPQAWIECTNSTII